MTNEEKYKTVEERAEAFNVFCNQSGACSNCLVSAHRKVIAVRDGCVLYWLALEAEEEDPINCPCCGGKAWLENGTDNHGYYWEYVVCHSCGLQTTTQTTKGAAVAKWNRRVK